jgi:diaminohydroxyphosphoribosylaminopyrimidine deaminase / 5-amino-6-(5-phosphoribosylamino)uracil reductase
MTTDETYMQRCLQLAALGAGRVAPNPMVGAVLVHKGRGIGEGYHQQYGQAHAEVNCLSAVREEDRPLIPESTMYVSLEPCAHFGKTPPCADRLITEKVKRVVIGCRDPFAAVNGKGIEKLEQAGIAVTTGVLEKEALNLNKRFFTFHLRKRPYVILKWTQSSDGFIAKTGEATKISGPVANRLVHRWRSEEAAIMIGAQTALIDNPKLNNRHWNGPSPVRIVLDSLLRIPASHHVLDGSQPTIIFNRVKNECEGNKEFVMVEKGPEQLEQVLAQMHQRGLLSVLVEGGASLLQSFITAGLWDEARIITNPNLILGEGVKAPAINDQWLQASYKVGDDLLREIVQAQNNP